MLRQRGRTEGRISGAFPASCHVGETARVSCKRMFPSEGMSPVIGRPCPRLNPHGDCTFAAGAVAQKDPRRAAQGRVSFDGLPTSGVKTARLSTWKVPDVFDAGDDHALFRREDATLAPGAALAVRLPPASLALLTLTFER